MKNFKKIFSLGLFILALVFVFSASKAEAYTRTAAQDGAWGDFATWGAPVPTASDDVIIPDNFVVDVDVTAVANSVTIQNAATTANGLTFTGTNSLTVTGAVTMAASTGAASTIAIGTGRLIIGTDLTITGDGTNDSAVTLATEGVLTVGDDIVFAGTAGHAKLTSVGYTFINLGGDMLPAAGTVTRGNSTLTLNGSADQSLGVSTTAYHNLVITNTGGTVTTTGQVTVNGNLTINEGTFSPGVQQLDVTGTTTINDGGILLINAANANKTFTGDLLITSGGAFTETAAANLAFGDDVTINSGGTMTTFGAATVLIPGSLTVSGTYTASTGVHTFSGAGKSISGTVTIPSVSISGTYTYPSASTFTVATLLTIAGSLTNTGTAVTASTALAGAGSFINGTDATLNIGGTSTITTLTATAAGNTVNYTGAAQTVKDPALAVDYVNLGLSGSGVKSIGANTDISGNLTIEGTAEITLADSNSSANKFYFGTSLQRPGTWGAVASSASRKNATYFTLGNVELITIATGSGSNSSNGGSSSATVTCGSTYTLKNGECVANTTTEVVVTTTPATPTTPAVVEGCTAGNKFSTVTGKPCASVTNPGVGNAYAFGNTVVKMGSKGEACKAWQTFLNDKAQAKLVTDGWCGKLTITAAKNWQKVAGLKVDGLLGAASRAKALLQ